MAATHFSKGSSLFALAVALFLVAIASAENYNPNGKVSTPTLEKLKSRMRQYGQDKAGHPMPELGKEYGSKSEFNVQPKPQSNDIVKPLLKTEEEKLKVSYEKRSNYGAYGRKAEDGFAVGVEGVVACKSESDYYPLQGAVVRITCLGETKESRCSTDSRGYFFKKLKPYGKPEQCKAFLEKSPSEKCSVPTDVNKGINGARLSSYRILHDKRIKLYPLGPFFYSSPRDYGRHQLNAQQQQVSKSPAGY